jgi:hypothetical protein
MNIKTLLRERGFGVAKDVRKVVEAGNTTFKARVFDNFDATVTFINNYRDQKSHYTISVYNNDEQYIDGLSVYGSIRLDQWFDMI